MERLLKAIKPTGNHRGPRDLVRITLGRDAKRKAVPAGDDLLDYDPVIAQADVDLILGHDPLRFL